LSYVGWVCCWFSTLLWEFFLRVLRFSSLHKNQHFKIPIRPGRQVFTHEPLAWEIRRLIATLWR